ncbi:MAG: hypothetical protein KGN76_03755 [Acidobacteriota bacterium]|nr:hypothetical protein [Acidobacteriota bacterium]
MSQDSPWPPLPLAAWQDTYDTLHMWLQIAGKIRMRLSPHVNHWWEVPLYVTARGLTTSPMPHGTRTFALTFDFVDHLLRIDVSDGRTDARPLAPMTVADFYRDLMARLDRLGLPVAVNTLPCEVPSPIRFTEDRTHAAYDAAAAANCWRVFVQVDRVFKQFRARFIGKVSPVHLFWGSFDLAVTRFNGRRAPEREWPQLPAVMRDAYSHEVISAGFWPGGGGVDEPAFYAYAVPEPDGFRDAPVLPDGARYVPELGEFILPYDRVRTAASPDAVLLDFLQSTYAAAADLGRWDRRALEW